MTSVNTNRVFWGLTFGILAIFFSVRGVAAADKVLSIGYLQLEGDTRYKEQQMEARYQGHPWGRPYVGASVAMKESRFSGMASGVGFELKHRSGASLAELEKHLTQYVDQGVRFVLLDLPGELVASLAEKSAGRDVMLFNLSAQDVSLRQQQCHAQLMHVVPSRAMLMDALAQFLIWRKWRRVLVLKGPEQGDADYFQAFQRAAKKFGLKIVDERTFVLGRDPRQRSRNNVALLTAGIEYDVVFVADDEGEFARDVPYQIQHPRPVVGAAGLVPDWWHWAWERHGAPQLNHRFFKKAKRHMTGYDWSAWVAVKVIVEAVQRTGGVDFQALVNYIRGDNLVVDGFNGYRLSFKPWNNQLRQPIFLTTPNWVVARAPLEGFLHARNNLDGLGIDERESRCQF